MGTSTSETIQSQIASGTLDSIYLILGDDEHQKADIAGEFEEAVDEGLRAFNVDRLHGGESSLGLVLDAARTLPVMVPRRLVIVLHAEHVIEPKRQSDNTKRDIEAFVTFLEESPSHVTIVLVSASFDQRRKFPKWLLKKATVVRCGDLKSAADVPQWIRSKIKAAGKTITPEAVRILSDRVGPDANRLSAELERLVLFAGNDREITLANVRDVAGPAGAWDPWAVTNAIEQGNTAVALRELARSLEDGVHPLMVLGQLAWLARTKLKRSEAVDAIFQTDQALKRSGGTQKDRILLERLVVQMCAATGGLSGRRRSIRQTAR